MGKWTGWMLEIGIELMPSWWNHHRFRSVPPSSIFDQSTGDRPKLFVLQMFIVFYRGACNPSSHASTEFTSFLCYIKPNFFSLAWSDVHEACHFPDQSVYCHGQLLMHISLASIAASLMDLHIRLWNLDLHLCQGHLSNIPWVTCIWVVTWSVPSIT